MPDFLEDFDPFEPTGYSPSKLLQFHAQNFQAIKKDFNEKRYFSGGFKSLMTLAGLGAGLVLSIPPVLMLKELTPFAESCNDYDTGKSKHLPLHCYNGNGFLFAGTMVAVVDFYLLMTPLTIGSLLGNGISYCASCIFCSNNTDQSSNKPEITAKSLQQKIK